jgi:thiamine biosynthesis lipoprotein
MFITPERRGPSRREFVAFGLGAFAVAALPLVERRRGHVVRRTMPVMGTIATFAVVHRDVHAAHAAIDAAMKELLLVERTMTRFTTTSDIGQANLAAARGPVAVGRETAYVVSEALRWADATDGAYDPAIGGCVALWDVTHRHEPPPPERVARLAGRTLYRTVEVDTHRAVPVVLYRDDDAQLDLGSIAKGYGVDRAVAALREHGVTSAIVEAGGDLYALGTAPGGDPWRVGIQDPNDDRALVGTVDVADAAVATSGTYRQFFRYRGRRYHHLVDPVTGAPRATPVQSLTIMADRCTHADVAATALFGMPPDRAAHVLTRCAPGGSIVRRV